MGEGIAIAGVFAFGAFVMYNIGKDNGFEEGYKAGFDAGWDDGNEFEPERWYDSIMADLKDKE